MWSKDRTIDTPKSKNKTSKPKVWPLSNAPLKLTDFTTLGFLHVFLLIDFMHDITAPPSLTSDDVGVVGGAPFQAELDVKTIAVPIQRANGASIFGHIFDGHCLQAIPGASMSLATWERSPS